MRQRLSQLGQGGTRQESVVKEKVGQVPRDGRLASGGVACVLLLSLSNRFSSLLLPTAGPRGAVEDDEIDSLASLPPRPPAVGVAVGIGGDSNDPNDESISSPS